MQEITKEKQPLPKEESDLIPVEKKNNHRRGRGPASGREKQKTVSLRINLRLVVIVIAVIIIGVLAFYFKGFLIAATVNGQPISRLAVIRELESVSGKNALNSLINQKLVMDEASVKKISINDDEINTEIKNAETQIQAQGMTLDEVLTAQNITLEDLKKQIVFQKTLEKLLSDKTNVTDNEVNQYMQDNQISPPAGQEAGYQEQIKLQLSQQKFDQEAQPFIDFLREQAKINYFWEY